MKLAAAWSSTEIRFPSWVTESPGRTCRHPSCTRCTCFTRTTCTSSTRPTRTRSSPSTPTPPPRATREPPWFSTRRRGWTVANIPVQPRAIASGPVPPGTWSRLPCGSSFASRRASTSRWSGTSTRQTPTASYSPCRTRTTTSSSICNTGRHPPMTPGRTSPSTRVRPTRSPGACTTTPRSPSRTSRSPTTRAR